MIQKIALISVFLITSFGLTAQSYYNKRIITAYCGNDKVEVLKYVPTLRGRYGYAIELYKSGREREAAVEFEILYNIAPGYLNLNKIVVRN